MRKIINSAFVSPDGVTEDPRSWAIFDPDSAEDGAFVTLLGMPCAHLPLAVDGDGNPVADGSTVVAIDAPAAADRG